jgi:uncharacterized protein with GYD domain
MVTVDSQGKGSETLMSKYVLLARATDVASTNILVRGADGLKAQQEAIAALGGRVEAQFVVTGDYDIVLVVDLPTDVSVLALSVAFTSTPCVRMRPKSSTLPGLSCRK